MKKAVWQILQTFIQQVMFGRTHHFNTSHTTNYTYFYFSNYYFYLYIIFTAISVAAVLWILNDRINPAYKIAWILPIVVFFPMFGGLFYIFFGRNKASRRTKRN